MLSASQLDASGADKKKMVMDALKQLDIPGYDEQTASIMIDVCVRVYKSDEVKQMIVDTKKCCKRRFFQ